MTRDIINKQSMEQSSQITENPTNSADKQFEALNSINYPTSDILLNTSLLTSVTINNLSTMLDNTDSYSDNATALIPRSSSRFTNIETVTSSVSKSNDLQNPSNLSTSFESTCSSLSTPFTRSSSLSLSISSDISSASDSQLSNNYLPSYPTRSLTQELYQLRSTVSILPLIYN